MAPSQKKSGGGREASSLHLFASRVRNGQVGRCDSAERPATATATATPPAAKVLNECRVLVEVLPLMALFVARSRGRAGGTVCERASRRGRGGSQILSCPVLLPCQISTIGARLDRQRAPLTLRRQAEAEQRTGAGDSER